MTSLVVSRHCEEPTGPAFGRPDDKLRDEAIDTFFAARWIASRSLSSGAHSRDPLARNDEKKPTDLPDGQITSFADFLACPAPFAKIF
jgi:hypothetical protein